MINKSSVNGFRIFNSNDWSSKSKAILQTCATEFSLIEHTASKLEVLCSSSNDICIGYFNDLLKQWENAKWDNSRYDYYVQVPELHYLILVILCSIKGLLDSLVKLLNTENIINSRVNGFNKANDNVGGRVLNALQRNVSASHKTKANIIYNLIVDHKENWIDEVVLLRDRFIHLDGGAHQIMLNMNILIKNNKLVFEGAYPPLLKDKRIDLYLREKIISLEEFSKSFLEEIKS